MTHRDTHTINKCGRSEAADKVNRKMQSMSETHNKHRLVETDCLLHLQEEYSEVREGEEPMEAAAPQ